MKEKDNIYESEDNYNITTESRVKLNQSLENNIKLEKDAISQLNSNNEEEKEANEKKEEIKEADEKNEKEENSRPDINDISEENLSIIKSKIEQLRQKYNFSINYSGIILNFIYSINELLNDHIDISIKDNLNNISFFNKLSDLYSDLFKKLKSSNITLSENNSNIFKDSIINIKNVIELDFSQKSENFKRKTVSCNKIINQKVKKIEEIKKISKNKYNKINVIKNLLESKYSEKYTKLFDSDIKNTNVPELPDLVVAIIDLSQQINLLTREINIFIEKTKESFISLNNLFNEINTNVKEILTSFINENKNTFSEELNQKIEEIGNKLEENNPSGNYFSFSQIITSISQRKNIYTLLDRLSILLNIPNDLNSEENSFLIEKYENIISFFEFLLQNEPEITSITTEELITNKMEVQYYPGILRTWKDCFILFTSQKHLIICDKKDIYSVENVIQIFEKDKINFRLNSSFERPLTFEICPDYDLSFKRYNTFSFNALSNQNLFDLCVIFKDHILKKGKNKL